MSQGVLRVRGYRDFVRACARTEVDSRKYVRAALKEAGEIVRDEAERLFDKYDARSASRYRVRVRQRGVAVEQSLRKTTGEHPEYGALQMTRALLPARARKTEEIESAFELAVDRIADHFDH